MLSPRPVPHQHRVLRPDHVPKRNCQEACVAVQQLDVAGVPGNESLIQPTCSLLLGRQCV